MELPSRSLLQTAGTMANRTLFPVWIFITVYFAHRVLAGWEMLSPDYVPAIRQDSHERRQQPNGSNGPRTILDPGYGMLRSRLHRSESWQVH